jgi:hypothetical protein
VVCGGSVFLRVGPTVRGQVARSGPVSSRKAGEIEGDLFNLLLSFGFVDCRPGTLPIMANSA